MRMNLGYGFETEERLRVYLTNTLEEAFQIPPAEGEESWIWNEADAANRVKEEAPVMVVMGNPPYSGHSANNGEWISGLLRGYDSISGQATSNYFEVDGKPLGERNPKWLNDDYVKFTRFGQWRIEKTGYGILAFVTNHGFIENSTFRGMRQSLAKTFDDIYILDLHGNSKKKEVFEDDSKDENVFDIQQGVCICIFVKRKNQESQMAKVHHAHLHGMRNGKYNYLENHSINLTDWVSFTPKSPFHLFLPKPERLQDEYQSSYSLRSIMEVSGVGLTTARDHVVVDYDSEALLERASLFRDSTDSDEELCRQLDIPLKKGWDISKARNSIKLDENLQDHIKPILYRIFDKRNIFYHDSLVWRTVKQIMRNFPAPGQNLGIVTARSIEIGRGWEHIFCTEDIIQHHTVSIKEVNYVFPLYLYPETKAELAMGMTRRPNLSQPFLDDITNCLGYTPTPEAIFHYIYAIFHSPTYRTRYAEFLKIDFPRVPLTSNNDLFTQLATLGEQLVQLHLMKSPKLTQKKAQPKYLENGGDSIVDAGHPKYINGNVLINKKGDTFTQVPEQVWNFHIGGYQVCHKWLKDRKGRQLSPEDIQHYQQIVVALGETIRVMESIDQAIPSWPIS